MDTTVVDLCREIRRSGLWAHWDEAPGLGGIVVGGSDSLTFLQSQLTSDVAALQPGGHQMSARVDLKGRLLTWLSLHRLPDRGQPFPVYMLVMSRTMVNALKASLEQYIFDEDVFLEDMGDQYTGVLVAGDGIEIPEFSSLLSLPMVLTGDSGRLILWPTEANPETSINIIMDWVNQQKLIHLDNSAQSTEVWFSLLLEAGWPVMGRDLEPNSMVLLQTGLERHVVSTTKGCYLGQEVLVRIRSYGAVKLAMRGVVFLDNPQPETLPASGKIILDSEGNKLGIWGSNTFSTVWDAKVALAFLNRENRTAGSELVLKTSAGNFKVKIIMLPFYDGAAPVGHARSLYERAVHLFSQGQDLKAANLLEKAIGLDPGHVDAYEALGVILGGGERYYEAIDIFHRLEEVAPNEPMVNTNLSLYYMKIGNKEEAERQRALSTMKQFGGADPAVLLQQEKISNKLIQEEAQRKRDMYAEVLAMDPADSLALMGMGGALTELGEFDDAEYCLGKAVASQAENSSLYLSHGKVLEKLGRTDEARLVLQRGIEVASRRGDLMPLREMEHRLLLLG